MGNPLKTHVVPRNIEIWGGVVLFVIGAWLLWCAFEGRGKKSPFLLGIFTPF